MDNMTVLLVLCLMDSFYTIYLLATMKNDDNSAPIHDPQFKTGDKLDWVFDVKNGEMIIVVRPIKKSNLTKPAMTL